MSLQISLPADAERKSTKTFEEVVIPPNTPVAPSERETPIPISSLDEVSVVCCRWLVVVVVEVVETLLKCQKAT